MSLVVRKFCAADLEACRPLRDYSCTKLVISLGFAFRLATAGNEIHASDSAASTFIYFRSDAGLATGNGRLPERLDDAESLSWRVAMDSGHSTPLLAGGKILLTTYRLESRELAV